MAYEVDTTPPGLTFGNPTPAANAAGWNNTPVDVPFTTTGIQSADPAGPLHFTSDGANQTQDVTLTHRDGVMTVTSPVINLDMTAPTTSANVTGNGGGEFLITAQVTLSPSDNLSGVANTFYSLSGGPTQTYTSEFSVTNNGTHTLKYWSVDVAGNSEQPRFSFFKVDNAPPFTSISLDGTVGANNWFKTAVQSSLSGVLGNLNYYTTPVQVTLTASDNVSGIASVTYRIDGGNANNYLGAFTVSTDGNHTVDYWTTDKAGNSSTISTVSFKIDKTAPVTQVSFSTNMLGNDGWNRGPVQVSMSATDSQSGVQVIQYRIDGGTLKTYTSPFNYSSNGIHTITYWSVDKVLNTETAQNVQLKIDQQAPSITVTATPSSAVVSETPVTVTVSGRVTDALSGINPATVSFHVIDEYSVFQPSGPVTLKPNGDFSFTLIFPATKNAGDRNHVYTIYISAGDMAGVGKQQTDTFKIN